MLGDPIRKSEGPDFVSLVYHHFLLEQTAVELLRICLISKEASWWRWQLEEQRKGEFYCHKLLENG